MSYPSMVTFIGGPWDLHRVAMVDPPPDYDVAIADTSRVLPWDKDPNYPCPYATFKTARYRLFKVPDIVNGGNILLYLHAGTRHE